MSKQNVLKELECSYLSLGGYKNFIFDNKSLDLLIKKLNNVK